MSDYEAAAEIREAIRDLNRSLEFGGALLVPTIFGDLYVTPRAVLAVGPGPEGRGIRVHIGNGTAFDVDRKKAPRATPRSVALYLARGGPLEPFDKAAPTPADESRAAAEALLAALEDDGASAERVRDCARRLLDLLPRRES